MGTAARGTFCNRAVYVARVALIATSIVSPDHEYCFAGLCPEALVKKQRASCWGGGFFAGKNARPFKRQGSPFSHTRADFSKDSDRRFKSVGPR